MHLLLIGLQHLCVTTGLQILDKSQREATTTYQWCFPLFNFNCFLLYGLSSFYLVVRVSLTPSLLETPFGDKLT